MVSERRTVGVCWCGINLTLELVPHPAPAQARPTPKVRAVFLFECTSTPAGKLIAPHHPLIPQTVHVAPPN